MTAPSGPGPAIREPPTLEVRWIRPGELDGRTSRWFDRFPAMTESRRDDYLISPDLGELSVKLRAGRALEVKMYRGLLGILEIPGHARGLMEFWQKWSFPLGELRYTDESSSWQPIHKVRRLTFFSGPSEHLVVGVDPPAGGAGCAVELTEVTMLGRNWWTLGFEANGPEESLRETVESTATHVFGQAAAEGTELTLKDSGSYSSLLRDQLD
ncbi:MAG TPA: hypothetical protein VH373_17120 [Jatrophihabitantaceae bacterium]|jgi:hypothetical protein